MPDRVRLGQKNGRIGAWVSAPGQSASSESARMLLDSDLDNLKPWWTGSQIFDDAFVVGSGYGIQVSPISFPALPFVPLALVSIAADFADFQVSFPLGINWDGADYTANAFRTSSYRIYPDRVEFANNEVFHWTDRVRIGVAVFANRIESYA